MKSIPSPDGPPLKWLLLVAALLSACATPVPPPTPQPAQLPSQWLSPQLPDGQALAADWWRVLQEPDLQTLVQRAWAQSPTLAQARARLALAQAQQRSARASLGPVISTQAQATRGAQAPEFRTQTTGQWTVQAAWEIDLFGSARAQASAAERRSEAAALNAEQARLTLSVEVVQSYLAWRHALAQLMLTQRDAELAERNAKADAVQAEAGLLSAATAAISQTLAANARSQRQAWEEQRGIWLQTLAVLTATDASALAAEFNSPPKPLPAMPTLALDVLPASLLARRADLAAAHRQWQAAALEARGVAIAQHAPQLSFDALVGRSRWEIKPEVITGTLWRLAPTLSLPIWDSGARAAQTQAAQAAEAEARAELEARWRLAVAEVEQALLRWQAASANRTEAEATLLHWARIDAASAAQAQAGLVSGQTRLRDERNALAARGAAIDAARDHTAAWLQLVRALGGGWQAAAPVPNT